MRPLAFFRASLALPFVVPAIVWLAGRTGHAAPLSSFLMGSLLFGGVPYLGVVATLWWVSHRRPLARFMTWWRLSPLLMALMLGPWAAVVSLFGGGTWRTGDFFSVWAILGIYGVVVGYLYVALAGLAYLAFERLGLVRAERWWQGLPAAPHRAENQPPPRQGTP